MRKHIRNLNKRMLALSLIILIVILSFGSYIVYAASTETFSLGTNVEGSLNFLTGELTIKSTSGVGSINNPLKSSLEYDSRIAATDKITFLNKVELSGMVSNYAFADLRSLKEIQNIDYLDISQIYTLVGMFKGCSSLTSVDISGWDTSHVKQI